MLSETEMCGNFPRANKLWQLKVLLKPKELINSNAKSQPNLLKVNSELHRHEQQNV